jgi:hypothetical protein
MGKYLLQKGDVIRLEENMTVYASIPAKFVYRNAPFSAALTEHTIKIGRMYRKQVPRKVELVEKLTEELQRCLRYEGINETKVAAFVDELGLDFSIEDFDTTIFIGDYRVYHTCWDGGSGDFPDGWHVYAEKLDNPEVRVHFYQTVGYAALISDVNPIGHEA